MTEDQKLAVDESERVARYQELKGTVREGMQAEIARQVEDKDRQRREQAAVIGDRLEEKSIREIASTETEIERARGAARISQVVDYIFFIIYALIGLEIFLEVLGARDSSGFKRFIDALTAPLLGPFYRLLPDLGSGRFQLRVSDIVALVVYILLHLGINGLLRLLAERKTNI